MFKLNDIIDYKAAYESDFSHAGTGIIKNIVIQDGRVRYTGQITNLHHRAPRGARSFFSKYPENIRIHNVPSRKFVFSIIRKLIGNVGLG